MAPTETTSLVHIVASVNMTDGTGAIHYVNPSNVRSSHAAAGAYGAAGPAGPGTETVALVMRDAAGAEIARAYPEVRYEACSAEDAPKIGLIQHDVAMAPGLATVDLVRGDALLDRFEPDEPTPPAEIAAGLGLGPPQAGRAHKRAFGADNVGPQKGVTYMIQVKPDNRKDWQTLSIGRETPDFVIDKNQFPGATRVAVRVIQNAGFQRATIDEREVALED